MLRSLRHAITGRALVAACVLLSVVPGCSRSPGEGFAIYLTRNDISPADMEKLSHVDIADEPVIALDDIIWYSSSTHEMLLTDEAITRLSELQVPVQGRSFVVCVDRSPVYWGAFWVLYSSQSFDGVTIWIPLGAQGPDVVALQLGYPSSSFHEGQDPRNNPYVIAALDEAGKLFEPTDDLSGPLPRSFKGYELYSWYEASEWRFALLTGTNRNKTAQEVRSAQSTISAEGWVHIHAEGVDGITAVLSRLPQGEHVFWLAELRDEHGDSEFALPPDDIVQAVAAYAEARGLDFFAQPT